MLGPQVPIQNVKCSGVCLGLGSCANAPAFKATAGGGAVAGLYELMPALTKCIEVRTARTTVAIPRLLGSVHCYNAHAAGVGRYATERQFMHFLVLSESLSISMHLLATP